MKYIDEPLIKYLEDASSSNPTPGGGSVAGLTAALACSMANMVCNFTIGKKAYLSVDEKTRSIFAQSKNLMQDLLNLTVLDTEAYSFVSSAYKLPKNTEHEKQIRKTSIQEACIKALEVPEKIMEKADNLLSILYELVDIGNKNLITDTGVASILSKAAIDSAILNIKINLSFIDDKKYVDDKINKILKIEENCILKNKSIMEKVNSLL